MLRKIKLVPEKDPPKPAFVTVGNGQIHFGIAACALVPGCLDKRYVEFFRDDTGYLIGVRVTDTASEDSIPMKRFLSSSAKKAGAPIASFSVDAKSAIVQVFGTLGASPDSVKCKVSADPDSYDMFLVDIRNPRKAKTKKG